MMCSKAVISLILPLCGLPILSADFTEESAIQYLQKFGHINSPTTAQQQPASCRQVCETSFGFEESVQCRPVCETSFGFEEPVQIIKGETLRKYQAFIGLPQTGTLDDATKRLMKSPRCGQEDISYNKHGKWKKKNLTYRVVKHSTKISNNAVDRICRKAMDMWEEAANIRFIHVTSRKPDIEILFGTREHGDSRAFDGPWTNKDDYKSLGAEIAHAFYPSSRLAGDVHIDGDEDWSETFNIGLDLLHTVVHELGHSLGLEHSKGLKGTIMHPHHPGWVRRPLKLHANDIERIQGLYGKPAGNQRPLELIDSPLTPPPTKGPTPPPTQGPTPPFVRRLTPPPTQGPTPPPTKGSTQNCEYECSSSGGCLVYYVGRHRGGKIKGSCFPDSFGGSCIGTPPECHDCNRAITCSEGGNPRKSGGGRKSSKGRQRKECEYECTSSGGCQVYYVGRPRSGKSKGSCFPDSFGGSCIGTPPECHDCNRAITCSEGGHPQRG